MSNDTPAPRRKQTPKKDTLANEAQRLFTALQATYRKAVAQRLDPEVDDEDEIEETTAQRIAGMVAVTRSEQARRR